MTSWIRGRRLLWSVLAAVAGGGLVVAVACGGGTSYSSPTVPPAGAPATAPGATQTAGGGTTAGTSTVMIAQAGALGQILTDKNGMTLYTFKNDVAGSGKSSVPAAIQANWPPLTLASGNPVPPSGLPGPLATFTRDDGSMQVTYKGMPLYTFVNDKAPGDTKGQGLGGVWFVAQP